EARAVNAHRAVAEGAWDEYQAMLEAGIAREVAATSSQCRCTPAFTRRRTCATGCTSSPCAPTRPRCGRSATQPARSRRSSQGCGLSPTGRSLSRKGGPPMGKLRDALAHRLPSQRFNAMFGTTALSGYSLKVLGPDGRYTSLSTAGLTARVESGDNLGTFI